MNKLKGFADDELYILKRAFIESSFKFFYGEKYTKGERKLHDKLQNEIVDEINSKN